MFNIDIDYTQNCAIFNDLYVIDNIYGDLDNLHKYTKLFDTLTKLIYPDIYKLIQAKKLDKSAKTILNKQKLDQKRYRFNKEFNRLRKINIEYIDKREKTFDPFK